MHTSLKPGQLAGRPYLGLSICAVMIPLMAAGTMLCVFSSVSLGQEIRPAAKDVQTVVSAGDQAYAAGRFQDAVKLYSDAAKVLPSEGPIFLGRGMAYEMLRDNRKAAEDFSKAIQCDPGNYRAMEQLAALYQRIGNKDAEAIALCCKALNLDPRPQWQEDLSASIAMLRTRLKDCKPTAVALWNKGNDAAGKGDFDGAASLYTDAIALNSQLYQAYFSRGSLMLKQKDFSAALTDFDAGLAIDERYPGGFVLRGLAHEGLGATQKALADFRRAATSDSWDPNAFYHLGRMLEKTGDFAYALQAYEKALTLNPKHDLPRLIKERINALRSSAGTRRRADSDRLPVSRNLW